MIRNRLSFTAFALFSALALHAQEKLSYLSDGQPIVFTISQSEAYVEFPAGNNYLIQRKAVGRMGSLTDNSALIKITDQSGGFSKQKETLSKQLGNTIQKIEPVCVYKDGTRQIATGELIIQLVENASPEEVLKGYNFDIKPDRFTKNQYLVKLDLETFPLFRLVDKLQQNSHVVFAEPNFIRIMMQHSTDDTYFPSQWAIKNTGQIGDIDADMDVDSAWMYSTGRGIKVAVIDVGVDLTHPDLSLNMLPGYDATAKEGEGGKGAPVQDNAHGTACAGIIAATTNNIGVVGVAYDAKIIPIKMGTSADANEEFPFLSGAIISQDAWMANSINWAWENGADVLSNSWLGGSPSKGVPKAIMNALNKGRDGKGSVVLFASGNLEDADIGFPATLESVITVGASSMCDERKSLRSCDGDDQWGSQFGDPLDVVAPGVGIYTTDIVGEGGYNKKGDNEGDFTAGFSGTSAACPHAAGVVALILSANPNLTQKKVREILEKSVDKPKGKDPDNYHYSYRPGHPHGKWNEEVGYGRLNALRAVKLARNPSVLDHNVFLFPNPADGSVFINLSSLVGDKMEAESQILISNLIGEVILKTETTRILEQINVSELKNGVYVFTLSHEGSSVTEKLIIQH